MAKINFKKNHLILPLIILPFLFVFYFIFFGTGDEPTEQDSAANIVQEGFNSALPNAQEMITPDRMQAYKDQLKKRRLTSGMKELDGPEGKRKLEDEENAKRIDSLKQEFEKSKVAKLKRDKAQENREKASSAAAKTRDKLLQLRNKQTASSKRTLGGGSARAPKSKKQDEMEAFKKQMTYLDSLQNPEKYVSKVVLEEDTDKAFKITKDSGKSSNTDYFNTIKADLNKTMISAILDEGIKAWEGSRVRIRLLEPIYIDGRLLDKGQYLYGIVSGFKAQRLIINISSVIIADEIIPMDVSIYDNDGIEGIYIPDSSFRTFTKELGANSSQGRVNLQSPSNDTQALYQSVSQAVQSSTKAVQRALKKNKATLKYNTQVYLVNQNK